MNDGHSDALICRREVVIVTGLGLIHASAVGLENDANASPKEMKHHSPLSPARFLLSKPAPRLNDNSP